MAHSWLSIALNRIGQEKHVRLDFECKENVPVNATA